MTAVLADVRFHCPACGAALRTRPRDAGTVVTCHLCGEIVRAPRTIPIAEMAPMVYAVTPHAARKAASACRVLVYAHLALVLQVAVVAAGYSVWAYYLGPAKLFERDPAGLFPLLLPFWLADLALVVTQTVLKMIGYQRLEPSARPLGATAWLSATRWATLARLAGYALATLPWLAGNPLEALPMVWKAVAQVGHLAWILGIVTEFTLLGFWYRVMAELGGTALARTIFRYLTVCLATMMTLSAGLSLTLIAIVAAVRKATPEPHVGIAHGARLNFAALPAQDYWPALALAGIALAAGAVLAAMYWQLLRRAERALLSIARG